MFFLQVKEERIYGEEKKLMSSYRRENLWKRCCRNWTTIAEKLEKRHIAGGLFFVYTKRGMELLKLCGRKLDTVEKKMLQLNEMVHLVNFQDELAKRTEETEKVIRRWLACRGGICQTMAQAMNYSMLAGEAKPSANVDPGEISPV